MCGVEIGGEVSVSRLLQDRNENVEIVITEDKKDSVIHLPESPSLTPGAGEGA